MAKRQVPAHSRTVRGADITESSYSFCIRQADHIIRKYVIPGVSVIIRHVIRWSKAPERQTPHMVSLFCQCSLNSRWIKPNQSRNDMLFSRSVFIIVETKSVLRLYISRLFHNTNPFLQQKSNFYGHVSLSFKYSIKPAVLCPSGQSPPPTGCS